MITKDNQIENKIVFYLVLTLTCMGFLIGLGALYDNNNEAIGIGVVLTISGVIIIRYFYNIFPNKKVSASDI